jgi:predicted nucleic acid-binding protein
MSQRRYLLDTELLVEHLRGKKEARAYIDGLDGDRLVSVVTVAELFVGVHNPEEEQTVTRFLNAFDILPLTAEIARQGGLWRRAYRQSHGTGLADALIAATAVAENAVMVTFNTRHFPMLQRVEKPYDRA